MPRTEVTKKIWNYIKKNNLQDSVNRRMINADDKLKKIFALLLIVVGARMLFSVF
jgi:chromatin remodeling complex protein RSC6